VDKLSFNWARNLPEGRRSCTAVFLVVMFLFHLLVNLPQFVEHGAAAYFFYPSSDLIVVLWIFVIRMLVPSFFCRKRASFFFSLLISGYVAIAVLDSLLKNIWNRPLNFWLDFSMVSNFFEFISGTYSISFGILMAVFAGAAFLFGVVGISKALDIGSTALSSFFERFGSRKKQDTAQSLAVFGTIDPKVSIIALILISPLYSGFQKLPRWTGGIYPSQGVFLAVKNVFTNSFQSGYYETKAREDIGLWHQRFSDDNDSVKSRLSRLKNTNVVMIIVESYGATLFENPDHFRRFEMIAKTFGESVEKLGYKTVSGIYESTKFGGGSWMADAALSCGLPVSTDPYYKEVLKSNIFCLGRQFSNAGFNTFETRGGVYLDWPEGKFFGYGQSLYHYHMDYKGPRYDWGLVPDQYTLQLTYEKFLKDAEAKPEPFFSKIVLISSHAPWNLQPPFIEDLDQITKDGGDIFNRVEGEDFTISNIATNTNRTGLEGFEFTPYLKSISYVFRSMAAYLQNNVHEETMFMIIGDHQPLVSVTGKKASWGVPVHVLSKSAAILKPFLKDDFVSGMRPNIDPSRSEEFRKFKDFLPWFLDAFSKYQQGFLISKYQNKSEIDLKSK